MPTLEQTVAELQSRVARLEDELAIHRLIASYGLAVDVGGQALRRCGAGAGRTSASAGVPPGR